MGQDARWVAASDAITSAVWWSWYGSDSLGMVWTDRWFGCETMSGGYTKLQEDLGNPDRAILAPNRNIGRLFPWLLREAREHRLHVSVLSLDEGVSLTVRKTTGHLRLFAVIGDLATVVAEALVWVKRDDPRPAWMDPRPNDGEAPK